MSTLAQFVRDFAVCMQRVDARRPQAVSFRSKEPYQPGIGPPTESQTVQLVADEPEQYAPERDKGRFRTGIS